MSPGQSQLGLNAYQIAKFLPGQKLKAFTINKSNVIKYIPFVLQR